MRNRLWKVIAMTVAVLTLLGMLGGCVQETDSPQTEEQAVLLSADLVTILADGKEITIEDTENMTLQQLLERADIRLNEGDILSVDPAQLLSGNVTVQVLRRAAVTITVAGETPQQYTVVLVGGTVADALRAAGLELDGEQQVNISLEELLTDGMQLQVSAKQTQEEEENQQTPNTGGNTGGSTEPSTPQKTVVSVQYYDDCDGSGHGVKVITYSDGTQEEVPY